jgi:hypothetical protein
MQDTTDCLLQLLSGRVFQNKPDWAKFKGGGSEIWVVVHRQKDELDLGASSLILWAASSPFKSGIPMSTTITSGRSRIASATIARPSATTLTTV